MDTFDTFVNAIEEGREQAEILQAAVKSEHPGSADEARQIIIDYLGRYDRGRMKVYLGETPDSTNLFPGRSMERFRLESAQGLICLILEAEKEGQPVRPILKDVFIRKILKLPFLVIDGSHGGH